MPPPLPPMGGITPGMAGMAGVMPPMSGIPPTMPTIPGIPPTMPTMPAMPGMPVMPGMNGVNGVGGIPPVNPVSTTPLAGNPAGNLSGTTTNQLRLIYTRTDLSMEEWRALQPQYRYQEFLTEANAVV